MEAKTRRGERGEEQSKKRLQIHSIGSPYEGEREMEEMESLAGKLNPSPVAPEDAPLEFSGRNNAPESPQKPKAISVPDISGLVFEAKSSKDGAWYDVATFLHHRFLPNGEFEVRVRFAGYGKEDDEWVNVERAVRDRSIPLKPSECDCIEVGDLVLCFRDTDDEATYYDAHIVKIQRKKHDDRCCRCIFVVRYDHDGVKKRTREGKTQIDIRCGSTQRSEYTRLK